MDVGGVEQDGHITIAGLIIVFLDIGKLVLLKKTGTNHEYGEVYQAVDDLGVGNNLDGRAVENDEVVFLPEAVDESVKILTRKQFGGIERNRSYGNGIQSRRIVYSGEEQILFVHPAYKIIGDALFLTSYQFGERSLAEVKVYDQHLLSLNGKNFSQVNGDEGLTGTRIGRCDGDNLALVGRGAVKSDILEIGAYYAESLVDGIAAFSLDHNLVGFGLFLLQAIEAAGLLDGRRYLAEIRYSKRLKILFTSDLRIEHFAKYKNQQRYDKTYDDGHQIDGALYGRSRRRAAVRLLDHARIVGRKSLRQFVFLTLLKKEQIKLFLYLLLTFHTEQVFRLVGVGGNLSGSDIGLLAGIGHLRAQGSYIRVERSLYVTVQGAQCLGSVLDDRVDFARSFQQTVTVQHRCIILGYCVLDIRVDNACIGGQRLTEILAGQFATDHLGHGQLVVEFGNSRLRGGRLAHIHGRSGIYIRQEMS